MRDYGKVAPQFWTGQTGKALKAGGPEAVIVAMYLMTSPHANMIGIYYLPQLYLAHETGLGVDGAAKGLRVCVEAGFCAYDEDTETIFVPRMASYQVAESLSVKDNRRIAVLRELDSVGSSEFADMFRQLYATPFCLEAPRYPSVPHHRFSPSLVRQVVEACGGVCKGCGTPFSGDLKPTIDHVVAKINGGTLDRANLQALCGPCNSRKAVLDRALFWERSGLEATPYEGVSKGSIESAGPLASQEQEQEQEQEQKKEPKPRSPTGSRLPADWALPDEWLAWGQQERPELDVAGEGDKFRDFWHGKAGKDGRKADWLATWRNWIRNARAPFKPANGRASSTGYQPLPGEV